MVQRPWPWPWTARAQGQLPHFLQNQGMCLVSGVSILFLGLGVLMLASQDAGIQKRVVRV